MSKNHPHDNIYSILGKLDALKPTPEEKRMSLVKEIRESIEARGSIVEGVDAVQAKLARQFAEGKDEGKPGKTFAKIAKSAGEHYGSAEAGKRVAGAVKAKLAKQGKLEEGDVVPTATGLKHKGTTGYGADYDAGRGQEFSKQKHHADLSKVDKTLTKSLEKGMDVTLDEKAPPGMEKMVRKLKKEYPGEEGKAFATAWSIYNKKHGKKNESREACPGCNECSMEEALSPEQSKRHDAKSKEEFIKMCRIEGMSDEQIKRKLARWSKVPGQEHMKGMKEDPQEAFQEGELTRKHGVTKHIKTDYPGYPSDDLEKDDDGRTGPKAVGGRGRPRKASTVNPRIDPNAPKKGRGRPSSTKSVGTSSLADPFGRTTGVAPKGQKGKVHSMSEAMNMVTKNLLTEGRYLEDGAGETLNHILNRFRAEVKQFQQGGDLEENLYDALYDYYVESGDMPYGVQKARTGDPMNWVAEHLDAELGDVAYGSDPANAEGYGIEDEAAPAGIGHDLVSPEQRVAQSTPAKPGVMGAIKDVAQGAKNWIQGKPEQGPTYEEADPMEQELNELARLAGLHSAGSQVRESFEQSQPEFSLNTSIDSEGRKSVSVNAEGEQAEALLQMLKIAGLGGGDKARELQANPEVEVMGGDEEIEDEGNEFSGELAQARAQHQDTFDVGGHEYEVDEADAPVSEPATKATNAPDEQYSSMRGSTMGPGEGDAGEKAMNPDRPTNNNGDNAMATPPTRAQKTLIQVAALESKLAAEYESIKKVLK